MRWTRTRSVRPKRGRPSRPLTLAVLLLGGMALAWGALASGAGPARAVDAARLHVIDGDTLPWQGDHLRVLSVDAPETRHTQSEAERARGQAATDRLRALLNQASLIEVAAKPDRDRYGRKLVRLTLDGEDRMASRWGYALASTIKDALAMCRKTSGLPFKGTTRWGQSSPRWASFSRDLARKGGRC